MRYLYCKKCGNWEVLLQHSDIKIANGFQYVGQWIKTSPNGQENEMVDIYVCLHCREYVYV
nr:MAG: hypothetical protein [Lokiarchaeota virus Skoll Meg22_1214]